MNNKKNRPTLNPFSQFRIYRAPLPAVQEARRFRAIRETLGDTRQQIDGNATAGPQTDATLVELSVDDEDRKEEVRLIDREYQQ